jgi:outer membrane protein/protease secretion system outer membrane protein
MHAPKRPGVNLRQTVLALILFGPAAAALAQTAPPPTFQQAPLPARSQYSYGANREALRAQENGTAKAKPAVDMAAPASNGKGGRADGLMPDLSEILGRADADIAGETASGPRMDLIGIYRKALENDPDWLAAQYENQAMQEEPNRARSALLPQVSFSGTYYKTSNQQGYLGTLGARPGSKQDYDSKNYVLQLRQPVYRPQAWAQYEQSRAQVGVADAQLGKDRNELARRVAEDYFDLLYQQERLRLAEAKRSALSVTAAQAERGYSGGVYTLTDVFETRSRLDLSNAEYLETQNAVRAARRKVESLVNQPIGTLAPIQPEQMLLDGPFPARQEAWIEQAQETSQDVIGARFNVEIARQEIAKQRSGHMPTLDLIAQRQYAESDTTNNIGERNTSTSVGVQVSIPLYAGGGVSASVRQAASRLDRAQQQLEGAQRKIQLQVVQEFETIQQGIDQIRAYEQAVASAEESYKGTRRGIDAGTRTTVDLLNAAQQIFDARASLARARYGYALATVRLKAAAGNLGEFDLEGINRWLRPADLQ